MDISCAYNAHNAPHTQLAVLGPGPSDASWFASRPIHIGPDTTHPDEDIPQRIYGKYRVAQNYEHTTFSDNHPI